MKNWTSIGVQTDQRLAKENERRVYEKQYLARKQQRAEGLLQATHSSVVRILIALNEGMTRCKANVNPTQLRDFRFEVALKEGYTKSIASASFMLLDNQKIIVTHVSKGAESSGSICYDVSAEGELTYIATTLVRMSAEEVAEWHIGWLVGQDV